MDYLYMFTIIASITHIVGLYWMEYLLEDLEYGMGFKVKHLIFIIMCPVLCIMVLIGYILFKLCATLKGVIMKSKVVYYIKTFLDKRII